MIDKANLKDIYPLSPMQEGMLFHALYDGESSAYIEQSSYRVTGDLDVEQFQQSWNELFKRHDILRTVFVHEKTSRPLQVVLKHSEVNFHFKDLRKKNSEQQKAFLDEYMPWDRQRSFELSQEPPLRVAVFHLNPTQYEVLWTYHHILMDGWSSGILLKELLEIYQTLREGRYPRLPGVVRYSEYIKWLENQDKELSKRYWKAYMDGYEEVATIPSLLPVTVDKVYEPSEVVFDINKEQSKQLNELAIHYQVTMSTLVQTVWGILLGRYNDREDVVFGALVSGRPAQVKGIEQMVGLFINTVPVRIRLALNDTFVGLIKRVQKESLEAKEHLYLHLAVVQGKQGIIDHIVAFENYPLDEQLQTAVEGGEYGIKISQPIRFEHTHYNFALIVNPGTCLHVVFQFNAQIYDLDQIERMAGHFKTVINAILDNPNLFVKDIDILPPDEWQRVILTFNDTKADFPDDKTIDSLFEEQVNRDPERLAIVWQNKRINYRELNERVNGLTHYLREQCHVQIEEPVAVILDRSDWLVISFLGILKAGGAYLPADPGYPKERIEFMLADSGCQTVLTDTEHMPLVPKDLTTVDVSVLPKKGVGKIKVGISTHNLAYVIYTSGSTGQPKGVMIEHRSAVNLVMWHRHWYGVNENSKATLVASPGFDASIWEMLPYLLSGACLYPISDENRLDTENLIRFYELNSITHSFVSPAICEEICRTHRGRLAGNMTLLTGGDVLKDLGNGDIQVVNNYGPTECTVVATSIFLASEHIKTDIPIGHPINNTQIFILDSSSRPLPIGIPGEIYIGGVSLARGYQNRPTLTAERFIEHPFQAGERLYRTGDLGQWLPDGNIKFLGRNDDQVKIRGYRVELGEIEFRLLEYPLITEALVTAQETSDFTKELVGYLVAQEKIDISELRGYMTKMLPDYMVPKHFVQLEQLPLTSSGKIDRNALLSQRDMARINPSEGHVGPRTSQERILTEIWAEVIGLEEIGIYDNFFDLGGHSLTATRVISKVRSKFQVEIPLRILFEGPTIAELAGVIEKSKDHSDVQKRPAIARVSRDKHRAMRKTND